MSLVSFFGNLNFKTANFNALCILTTVRRRRISFSCGYELQESKKKPENRRATRVDYKFQVANRVYCPQSTKFTSNPFKITLEENVRFRHLTVIRLYPNVTGHEIYRIHGPDVNGEIVSRGRWSEFRKTGPVGICSI